MTNHYWYCLECGNKIGESVGGTMTTKFRQRAVTVEGGQAPCRVTIVCDKCRHENRYDVCQNEIEQKH